MTFPELSLVEGGTSHISAGQELFARDRQSHKEDTRLWSESPIVTSPQRSCRLFGVSRRLIETRHKGHSAYMPLAELATRYRLDIA